MSRRSAGDVEVARTAPRGLWEKVTNPTVIEVWSQPGKKLTQPQRVTFKPGVCAVMSPGNFEALYQLFIEGRVVIAKSHPINASSSDIIASCIFSSLVRDGFVALCAGGPEMGGKLLQHKLVDSWMMTGGCGTFDAIVWGGKAGKAAGKKQLNKTCHAELGAASPYLVVPGAWTDKELEAQAWQLAGAKMVNAGHVCASPQTIVIDKDWPLANRFVDLVVEKLESFPAVHAYYPGTADRMAAIKTNCPDVRILNKNNKVHFVPDVDAPGGGGDYMLQNEAFGPALAIKYVQAGNDAVKYLEVATQFANTKCFGSLSLTMAISPASHKAVGEQRFDQFISSLRWGVVGVNMWAVFAAGSAYGTWGAPPGRHTPEDIQSGMGLMGNAYLLENMNKTVIKGTWCDPMMSSMWRPSAKSAPFVASFTDLQVKQSYGALFGVIKSALF